MQIEHKTEKGTLTFFLPPSRADRFKYFDDEKPYLSYFIGSETFREYFLKGTVFIGLTSEVTEEQAKMMVDLIDVDKCNKCPECGNTKYINRNLVGNGFRQCSDENCFQEWWTDIYYDAQNSKSKDAYLRQFKSLMQHLQVYDGNPLGKKPENSDFYWGYLEDLEKWLQSESRTGKWIVLFKPND